MRILIISIVFLLFSARMAAQNFDLSNNKQWNQLMQLNPALTAVGGELRTLINAHDGLNIGLETPLINKPWQLGVMYERSSIEQMSRNRFNAYVSHLKELKNNGVLRMGLSGHWTDQRFFPPSEGNYVFKDFSGFIYMVDSALHTKRREMQTYLSTGAGLTFEKKNLLFGLSARNLIPQDVSLFEGIELKIKPEISAQLGGYFGKQEYRAWFPSAVYSYQNGEQYFQFGVSHMRKFLIIHALAEVMENNGQFGFGLNYRRGPVFISLLYRDDYRAFTSLSAENLQFVLHFTLLKGSRASTEIVQKLKLLY